MEIKICTLKYDTEGLPLWYSDILEPRLQALDSTPIKVSIAALLEIGRQDLIKYIGDFGPDHAEMIFHRTPHIVDDNFDPSLPLEDWALIERAMYLGYKAFNLSYNCFGCEVQFNKLGVRHHFENV